MIRSLLPRTPKARRRRTRNEGPTASHIDILEPRILPTVDAINDTTALPSESNNKTVNPLQNDEDEGSIWVAEVSNGTYGTATHDGINVTYSLENLRTYAEYEALVDRCVANIGMWKVQQINEYEAIQDAVNDAIDAFGAFINANPGNGTWLRGVLAGGSYGGGFTGSGGFEEAASALLHYGVALSPGGIPSTATNAEVLDAMRDGVSQWFVTKRDAAEAVEDTDVASLQDIFTAMGNGPLILNDTITYWAEDDDNRDSAEIQIAINRRDYRNHIGYWELILSDMKTAWGDHEAATPAMYIETGVKNDTYIFGEMLKLLGPAVGGTLTLNLDSNNSFEWTAAFDTWTGINPSLIATKLNSMSYFIDYW